MASNNHLASASDLTVFSAKYSPFAARVRLALHEKNIPYKLIDIDFQNKPQEMLAANPYYATVPTMIHKGIPILESVIILEYLEEAFPDHPPLMPSDPILRSKFRFYRDYIYKNFPAVNNIAKSEAGTPEREAAVGYLPGFLRKLNEIMTEFSPEGPYFTGGEFTQLDVVLAPLTSYRFFVRDVMGVAMPPPSEIPRFAKWVEAVRARESVKAELVTPEEGKEIYSERLEFLLQKKAKSQTVNSK